ncbi:MAG: hypothetical protein QOJ21_3613 [Solirubrobacteraceae bacterium]|jgi:hypothetical protein|nr:hypothetical protein [Solirubrobacteraceae bacterium]
MRRRAILLAVIALLGTAAAGCGGKSGDLGGISTAPTVGARGSQGDAATDLGFPAFATKNTTRVGGADAVANAAAVARAVYPGPSVQTRPRTVALVDARDWRGGVAAAVLAAPPLRAAVLLSNGPDLPAASRDALAALAPTGAKEAGGAQLIRVGDVAKPDGLKATAVSGRDPFALAQAIDAYAAVVRARTSTRVVIASADDPGYAMPAAAWAAKAGDPVLFVHRNAIPAATRAALQAHKRPKIYVLGPPETISDSVVTALGRLGRVTRVGTGDAVRSSIDFARFLDGTFGWGVIDPGHGIVFARADRPLDAVAAAPLSASGTYGPLVLVSSAARLDAPVSEYLLDIQPGYTKDPVRGVYNHGWIVGDGEAISVGVQSQIDSLLEISPVKQRVQRRQS